MSYTRTEEVRNQLFDHVLNFTSSFIARLLQATAIGASNEQHAQPFDLDPIRRWQENCAHRARA